MASDSRGWARRAAGAMMPGLRVPQAWRTLASLYGLDITPGGLTGPTTMRGTVDGYRVSLEIDAVETTETTIKVALSNLPTGLWINQCRTPLLMRWRAVAIDDAEWSDAFSVYARHHGAARHYLTPARRRILQNLADPESVRFSRRWTVRKDSVSYTLKGAKQSTTELGEYIRHLLDLARALDPAR